MHENVHNPAVRLGGRYRDRITGFEGTATGLASYISGCDQVLLIPDAEPGKGYPDGAWLDDERLDVAATGEPVARTSARGGPQPSPTRR